MVEGDELNELLDLLTDEGEEEEEHAAMAVVVAALGSEPAQDTLARNWRGRFAGSRPNLMRGECLRFNDYLSPNPTYHSGLFRRRFRIPMKLFRILEKELPMREPLLRTRADARGMPGHKPWQKILASLRRLSTGRSFDDLDDLSRMSAESSRKYFFVFLRAMLATYGEKYLNRHPSVQEMRSIEKLYSRAGFPGCIGCVDTMKIKWKNCPKVLKGQFHNPKDGKLAALSCEAWTDRNLFCWHWFCGRPGTNNDITVVDNSPLFCDIFSGKRSVILPEGFSVNGERRQWMSYFLVDGIYPNWAIFVKPNHTPLNEQEAYMTKRQEAVRKDIERLFGCLQSRFLIVAICWPRGHAAEPLLPI